jgi:hypothetical protein
MCKILQEYSCRRTSFENIHKTRNGMAAILLVFPLGKIEIFYSNFLL